MQHHMAQNAALNHMTYRYIATSMYGSPVWLVIMTFQALIIAPQATHVWMFGAVRSASMINFGGLCNTRDVSQSQDVPCLGVSVR